tara:strand:- start:6000 stop:6266 length:267 start_codon:yes stop_codon:yes gene_type:complete
VAFLAFDWSPADNTMNIKDLMTLDASRMRNIVDLDRAGIHQRRHQTSRFALLQRHALVSQKIVDWSRVPTLTGVWRSCCGHHAARHKR